MKILCSVLLIPSLLVGGITTQKIESLKKLEFKKPNTEVRVSILDSIDKNINSFTKLNRSS